MTLPRRLTEGDVDALSAWLVTRVAVFSLSLGVWWWVVDPGSSWLDLFVRWDAVHYLGIAGQGYGGEPTGVPNEVFFPGFPWTLRLVGWVVIPDAVAALGVVAVSGAVAAVALARIAEGYAAGSGRMTVFLWAGSPAAIFLAAPYSEAMFCAAAFWCWYWVRQQAWVPAVLAATVASTVRISGLFLAVALIVAWATAPRRSQRWWHVGILVAPVLPILGWFVTLRLWTGSWTAWFDLQAEEWNRSLAWPWESAATTWRAADGSVGSDYAGMFGAELVAVAVGVGLTVWLLWRRRWGEATFVGLQLAALTTSVWFMSVPRATLLWWPLWVGVAAWLTGQPRWRPWVFAVLLPLSAAWSVAFLTGRWAG